MSKYIIGLLAALLVAGISMASQEAPSAISGNTQTWEICSGETESGTCDSLPGAGGVDQFATVSSFKTFTVYFSQTGTGATCEVYVGSSDLRNNLPTSLSTSDGTKINATSLSSSSTAKSYEAPFFLMWVTCTAGTAAHNVWIQGAR